MTFMYYILSIAHNVTLFSTFFILNSLLFILHKEIHILDKKIDKIYRDIQSNLSIGSFE